MQSFASSNPGAAAAVVLALSALTVLPASAPERHEFHAPRVELDARYHHDHYYPVHGVFMERLPVGSVSIGFGPARYYYHAGVWFRPVGPGFEVITPPIGVVIPALPTGYVRLTVGGAPYFYANGIFYAPDPAGYAVVAPPPGAETALPIMEPAPSPVSQLAQPNTREPVLYPRNSQTAAQKATDQRECRQWAEGQPGASDPSVLDRAQAACLDGRGYTVR